MPRSDSVARETLRLHSMGSRAVFRRVMVDDFRTEQGYHIPKGQLVSFFSQPVTVDPDKLEDAARLDPFRFSRMREEAEARNEEVAPVTMVSTSPEYMPFGHGKHACPGRFLIDFETKMILAYVLRNYDIEFPGSYKGQRPPNYWVAEALMPPVGARIRVKRRVV